MPKNKSDSVFVAVTVPKWICKEIIGTPNNKSQRVQELLIKGHMFEMREQQSKPPKDNNAVTKIKTQDYKFMGFNPKIFQSLTTNAYKSQILTI